MIPILAGLLIWIPAVAGWGSVAIHIRNESSAPPAYGFHALEPYLGMAILATLATAANFLVPITAVLSGSALLIGWLMLGLRIRSTALKKPSVGPILIALVWLAFVVFWSTQPPRNYDAGLYHLPAIKWINESATPLGLANLHGRLGFNSLWFSLAALLEFPFSGDREGTSAFLLTALLLCFYGFEVIRAVHQLAVGRRRTEDTVFLSLTAASLVAFTLQTSISSPTPDLPVFLFTLVIVFVALQALESDSDWTFALWGLLFLTMFSITVKLSALPLLLVSVRVLLHAVRHRAPVDWNRLTKLSTATASFLFGPWAIKGLLNSGCVAYPVAPTCFTVLPWSVPQAAALAETLSTRVWAHAPFLPSNVVSADWAWYAAWFSGIARSTDIIATAIFLILGLTLLLLSRLLGNHAGGEANSLRLAVPLIGCIAIWLVAAPDLRFGGGYFWALGASVLSAGACQLPRVDLSSRLIRICYGSLVALVAAGLFIGMAFAVLPPLNSLADRPIRGLLLTWPAIPSAQVSTHYTLEGVPISVPAKDQCWLAPLPCTPSFKEDLRILLTSHGRLIISRSD